MINEKKHKEHMHQMNVDCEQLIQKYLEAEVHPLVICTVLASCASELCKRGPIKKEDFLSMVESTWNFFDDVEESLKVMH
tara:strand:+ start:287 stop:526 length:240 start_codon:yes stop_codon:yes gene_type:complete